MQVIRISDVAEDLVTNPKYHRGGRGPVTRQPLVTEEMSKYFVVTKVNFSPGTGNKFQTHSADHVLVAYSGTGIVATETEERIVTVGDVVFFSAGENHWHGATQESPFSYLTVHAFGYDVRGEPPPSQTHRL